MSEYEPRNDDHNAREESRTSLADLYEKMSKVLQEQLERAGTLTEEAFERALKESREWAGRMKENYAEDIASVSESIRRDWLNAIRYTREQTRRSLDLDRLQAGVLGLLSRLARSAGSQLESFANRINERLSYKTGEIAGAGTLQCSKCGQTLTFEKARRIPPCPKCRNTNFTRSF
jgi:ElaB/YqjD/DUF883 family membrane-anchored ribosome-binding protein